MWPDHDDPRLLCGYRRLVQQLHNLGRRRCNGRQRLRGED